MKKGRLAIAGLVIGTVLVAGVAVFVYSASRARVSGVGKHPALLYIRLQQFWREKFPPAQTIRLDVTGPTGTSVIVGFRLDGSRSGILRGVIPTNCVITARRRVEVAIKNIGTNSVQLGFQTRGLSPGAPFGFGSSSGGIYPPLYGFSAEFYWGTGSSGSRSGGTLMPTNWPVTLPPGMTEQEAATRDFGRELIYLRLKDTETRLEQNPTDQRLLAAAGSYYMQISNRAAAEPVYQRFFATDCNDATFLNSVVYEYADHGGTNLDRAYELAVKAQHLAEQHDRYQLPFIEDTVAWIQLKRGYLSEALEILSNIKRGGSWPPGAVEFHLGMAHYMLLEEEAAAEAFQKVIDLQKAGRVETFESQQAKRCLAVLRLKPDSPNSTTVAKLRERLNEESDDPVALKRLAELYAADGAAPDLASDPLALKALGLRAYRSGEWSKAITFLSGSGKTRTNDAELFYFLGMAQSHCGQQKECEDSFRKAMALGLNPAQGEEMKAALASVALSGTDTNSLRR